MLYTATYITDSGTKTQVVMRALSFPAAFRLAETLPSGTNELVGLRAGNRAGEIE